MKAFHQIEVADAMRRSQCTESDITGSCVLCAWRGLCILKAIAQTLAALA
jgi:hypothetical protein